MASGTRGDQRKRSATSPEKQRALIFQGGGALGAYEAGVFKAFSEELPKIDEKNGEKRPLFDIVAGVSIGAVNACLLVNHVVQNKGNWQDSAQMLHDFWDDVSTATWWLNNPLADFSWDYWEKQRQQWNNYIKSFFSHNMFAVWWKNAGQKYALPLYFFSPYDLGPSASAEAARRYFSVWYFSRFGTPAVLSSSVWQPDFKFYDFTGPLFFRFDNAPLARTIKKYWDFDNSIKTSFENGEPRLLLVSVDLQNSTTPTFDSYETVPGSGIWKTEYGDDKGKYVIEYKEGIGMQHLMTSMSSHLKYKYPELEATIPAEINESGKDEKQIRHFWDGVYLSNTPLRELLHAHREYWFKMRGEPKDEIPDLEIYIVDLYPTTEKGVPQAADEILDREFDILFHDRSKYDEKMARMVSDYVHMSRELIDLAEKKGANEDEIHKIIDAKAKSMSRNGINRQYKDLLNGRFEITNVIRVERNEDGDNDIVGKAFDFSTRTIGQLREQGYKDGRACMEKMTKQLDDAG